MRKTIDLVGWLLVSFTIITLILTLLSTYHFTYIKYFDNYHTLQWCLSFTLLFCSVKLFAIKASYKSIIYSVLFILMAAGTMFFMFIGVY